MFLERTKKAINTYKIRLERFRLSVKVKLKMGLKKRAAGMSQQCAKILVYYIKSIQTEYDRHRSRPKAGANPSDWIGDASLSVGLNDIGNDWKWCLGALLTWFA